MKIIKHLVEINRILKEIKKYKKNSFKKLRFYHGGTNSTRKQDLKDFHVIDISKLNNVIEINTKDKYAIVEPNVSMDQLVNETLKYGFIPPVVMEFPGITVGGAINGGTLESSSFRYGQLSDTSLEYEIILGSGEIVHASPNKNSDLFYGISGTYGTLGLITLIKIRLIKAADYVHVAFTSTTTPEENLKLLKQKINNGKNDYIEGILFDENRSVVITGNLTNEKGRPIKRYSRAIDPWFYERGKSILKETIYEEFIPIKDYLFRYNRGAFWTGELAFPILHIPNNRFTKFLLNPFFNTRKMYDSLHALNISQEFFIQDFYCPLDYVPEFLKYTDKKLGIYPIWLCPVKSTKKEQKLSPHYINSEMLIDIGIWGQCKLNFKDPIGINKDFEEFAMKIGARKMLYAHAYYSEEQFWSIYNKNWYNSLRNKYHAQKIFPDVWNKVYVSERYKENFKKGVIKVFLESLRGKNINA